MWHVMLHMEYMKRFAHIFRCVAVAALVAPVLGTEWMTDLEAARTRAAAENKAVLVNFTGSDWCGYCIRMKRDVLDKQEFLDYTKDKFVLLEVDIPRHKKLDRAELERRRNVCRQYGVVGFPTMVTLSATGEMLGGWGGAQRDVASVIPLLELALERQKKLTAARQLQGVERARVLMEVYQDFPKGFKMAAEALRKEIQECDPEDTMGLKEQAAADAQMNELMSNLNACRRDYQRQTEIFDDFIARAHPLNRNRIMERKRDMVVFPCLNLMLLNAEDVADINEARDYVLKEAQTSYPEEIREAMIKDLEKTFSNPEALLERARSIRSRK